MHNRRTRTQRIEIRPWTNEEDQFLREYDGLPLEETTSALNKIMKTERTVGGVKKRRLRLRHRDLRDAALNSTPTVTLNIAGVTISGTLTPSVAKQVFSRMVFQNEFATGV